MFNKNFWHCFIIINLLSILGINVVADPIFGNTVTLHLKKGAISKDTMFLLELKKDPNSRWLNFDNPDDPQGDPWWPVGIFDKLNLPLGFRSYKSNYPVIPTFETLQKNVEKLKLDVKFFESYGLLPAREYLERFIKNETPIARVPESGDAHLFLHDMIYHVSGSILLPNEIRELAQKQIRYFLEFVDSDSVKTKMGNDKKLKSAINMLIKERVMHLDNSIGNLQFILLFNNYDFSKLSAEAKNEINYRLMSITSGSLIYNNGSSVELFMQGIRDECRNFKAKLADSAHWGIIANNLDEYIQSKQEDFEFKRPIEIDVIDGNLEMYKQQIEFFGLNLVLQRYYWEIKYQESGYNRKAIDLLEERIEYLRRRIPLNPVTDITTSTVANPKKPAKRKLEN
jgi:hypothetical protein